MPKWTKLDNVKGQIRCFNEKLLKRYDEPIRNKLKNILGDFILDNPDIYQQDFIINSDECRFKYLEVQICAKWINDYPYDNLTVYARKLKYDKDTLFLTVSKTLHEGYLFSYESIEKNNPKRVKKYSREFVYNVPWNKALKVYIDNLDELTFIMV